MKYKVSLRMLSICLALASTVSLSAQVRSDASTDSPTLSVDRIIDKAVEQERALAKRMTTLTPIIETYTQNMELNADLGAVPKNDKYFLGKLDLRHGNNQNSFLPASGWMGGFGQSLKQLYSVNFVPEGFAAMIVLGPNFEKNRYNFTYVRRE